MKLEKPQAAAVLPQHHQQLAARVLITRAEIPTAISALPK
jgi:hypothetical protein